MSEYIEIETELSDDGEQMAVYTNLMLSEGEELYETAVSLEEGSPVAQALAFIDGITQLRIEGRDMLITRRPDMPWHIIMSEVSAALKDFFL